MLNELPAEKAYRILESGPIVLSPHAAPRVAPT